MEKKSQNFSTMSERLPSEFCFVVLLVKSHFNKLSGFDKRPLVSNEISPLNVML
jgi:hypothetical protein